MTVNILITSSPRDLKEGLFGQVLLFIFEILPYLEEENLMPEWAIRSKLYGNPNQGFLVVPGLLDLSYEPIISKEGNRSLELLDLREYATTTLGNDWSYLNKLFLKYFRIPQRIVERANMYPPLDQALGLHYRGTDKNKSSSETNYVSTADLLTLTADFLKSNPDIRVIFVASDERHFVAKISAAHPDLEIVSSGDVVHHKNLKEQDNFAKGDHAMLDCLLLSRCKYLLKCQSALSGFAKVLNPEIEAYRISANKLAPWAPETPYFPDAYLPKYHSKSLNCQSILTKLFTDDWTENQTLFEKYSKLFGYEKRESQSQVGLLEKIALSIRKRFS